LAVKLRKGQKDREQQIWDLADRKGWKSVMNYKYAGIADGFDDFLRLNIPLMKELNFQVICGNLVEIEQGEAVIRIFDYTDFRGRTEYGAAGRLPSTAIYLRSDKLNLPAFTLTPEGMLAKIGGALGGQDIDFETNPAFSKSYRLRGADEARIRQIFNSSLLAFYEQNPGLTVSGAGNQFVWFRDAKLIAPEKYEDLLAESIKMLQFFEAASAGR
jgi:hypothetical protein